MQMIGAKIAIKIPERVDRIGQFYVDTSFPAGAQYSYEEEVRMVYKEVMQSKEAAYLKKYGQINKLRRIIESEISRIAKKHNQKIYGAGRYNNVCAQVLCSGAEDIKEGDTVYFNYNTIDTYVSKYGCFEDSSIFGGAKWTVIDYEACMFTLDKYGNIRMMHDWYLVKPIPKNIEKDGACVKSECGLYYYMPEDEKEYESDTGILYAAPAYSPLPVGAKVYLDKNCDIPVEYELIQKLPDKYFCVKGFDIVGIKINNNFIPLAI